MNRTAIRLSLVPMLLALMQPTMQAAEVTISPLPGVASSLQIKKAFEHAKEKNKTLVIVMTQKTVTVISCPSCAGKKIVSMSYGFMAAREFTGMMRILAYPGGDKPAQFNAIINQVPSDQRGSYPQVFIADPNTHKLLGFASRDTPWAERVKIFGSIQKIAAWQKKTDKGLAQIQRLIQAGQFNTVVRRVVKIMQQDSNVTKAMGSTGNGNILIFGDSNIPSGRFYGDLLAKTKVDILKRATDMIVEAEAFATKGKTTDARILLNRLIAEARNLIAGGQHDLARTLIDKITQQTSDKAILAAAKSLSESLDRIIAEIQSKSKTT